MKIGSKIYTALIFVFLYAPLLMLVIFSFNAGNGTSTMSGFSLQWYKEIFNNDDALNALKNTIILAVVSSVIATLLGLIASLGIYRMRNRWLKGCVNTVTNIPMMNPDIVTGVSMLLLFVFVGTFIGLQQTLGFGTMLLAHVTFSLPYVILNIMPKLRQLDKHLPEAAMDLGCTPFMSFMKVELPAIMPGVFSGLLMAFTLSIDDFVISYFVAGEGFTTLPLYIFSITRKKVMPDLYALSTLIFIAILVLLILINVVSSRGDRQERAKRKKNLSPRRLYEENKEAFK